MELKFKVAARISRPVEEVFEAVADPEKLSGYFTTGGAKGRLETGATVMWDFHDFPGAFPVEVTEVIPNEKISILWEAGDGSEDSCDGGSAGYNVAATMTFEALDDNRTLVTISEGGWRQTEAGLKTSYGNCEGWMQMLCSLKMWIEHGINLREGFYK
ncbi:SRPBCC family protein [Parasphingorhabdus sp.]|uniref:SRPBCC family protein n=1 Tax=Parasphingorhabdus sp. TaxID=2709688 RepID=UPI003C772AB3